MLGRFPADALCGPRVSGPRGDAGPGTLCVPDGSAPRAPRDEPAELLTRGGLAGGVKRLIVGREAAADAGLAAAVLAPSRLSFVGVTEEGPRALVRLCNALSGSLFMLPREIGNECCNALFEAVDNAL